MRFALMIEAQQGLSYDDQLAIARRAEASGFETLFRCDHYESFPGPAGSRRPTPGRSWRASRARRRRSGSATLVSPGHVPASRQLREARHDRRRDERRADRGRRRGRLERGRAPPPRAAVPGDRGAGRHVEEQLALLHGLWEEPDGWSFEGAPLPVEDALFRPKPASPPGPNGRPAAIITGGEGSPRSLRIAARYADEFNLSSATGQGRRRGTRPRRGLPGDRARPEDHHAARRWSGC